MDVVLIISLKESVIHTLLWAWGVQIAILGASLIFSLAWKARRQAH